MSAEASERGRVSGEDEPFVERDDRATKMAYDEGRVPLYVVVAWVLFIVAYITVMALVALPDLRAWMQR
jgi:hypothetical protein